MQWAIKLFGSVVFQTVISGVLVYILVELIKKFILEPIVKFRQVVAKIDNKLKFHANTLVNSIVFRREVAEEVRTLSCELEVAYKKIPSIFGWLLPSKEEISSCAKGLIFLSNSAGTSGNELKNDEEIRKIRKHLNIIELN